MQVNLIMEAFSVAANLPSVDQCGGESPAQTVIGTAPSDERWQ